MAWNKIFVIPNGEGEKVGVLLLDTQGAFDDDSDVKDVALIFALSTMISRYRSLLRDKNLFIVMTL